MMDFSPFGQIAQQTIQAKPTEVAIHEPVPAESAQIQPSQIEAAPEITLGSEVV